MTMWSTIFRNVLDAHRFCNDSSPTDALIGRLAGDLERLNRMDTSSLKRTGQRKILSLIRSEAPVYERGALLTAISAS